MLRWTIQDADLDTLAKSEVHPILQAVNKLNCNEMEQSFWFAIPPSAFAVFLAQENMSMESLTAQTVDLALHQLQKKSLPSSLHDEVLHLLKTEGFENETFVLQLMVHTMGVHGVLATHSRMSETVVSGTDTVLMGIKSAWMSLFNERAWKQLGMLGSSPNQWRVSLVIRHWNGESMRGSAYSFSPRCAWDRSHMVVAFEYKQCQQAAFLVDRQSMQSSYYGKTAEEIEGAAKTLAQAKVFDATNMPQSEKIRIVAESFLKCEKILGMPVQLEWSLDSQQRFFVRTVREFQRSPAESFFDLTMNTRVRHCWDQSFLSWNASAVLKPFWFSLIPRNFRILAIRYMNNLGVRQKVSPQFEKVFRGFWGQLRARPYINMAAFHRFLKMGAHFDLAEEIESVLPIWSKHYDREERDAWDHQWPSAPHYNKSEIKTISKKQHEILKRFSDKFPVWIDQIHELRETLVSHQWKDKNVSAMIEALQTWERKYVPTLVPILLAELQYWNLRSWYYQGAKKASLQPTWTKEEQGEPLHIEGSWLERRELERLYQQMELVHELRPKYLSLLEDVFVKLRKYFEQMGQKYVTMGQIEKAGDIFYLTLDEIINFEEGRASTLNWKGLVTVRQEELAIFQNDERVPEIWLTTGLVGLASGYPNVIAVKDRKNPRATSAEVRVKNTEQCLVPNQTLEQIDFVEEESLDRSITSDDFTAASLAAPFDLSELTEVDDVNEFVIKNAFEGAAELK